MSSQHSMLRLARTARASSNRGAVNAHDVCTCFNALRISSRRSFRTSPSQAATPTIHPEYNDSQGPVGQPKTQAGSAYTAPKLISKPDHLKMTPEQRGAAAAKRARENLKKQEKLAQANQKFGGLAPNSLYADEPEPIKDDKTKDLATTKTSDVSTDVFSQRSFAHMSLALNPRPSARARWQRRMVIRHIRHGTRLTRQMIIARTERSHLSKSHFFKTSMKKLAPLARQIAGKPIDEAILQMRFSKKKAAQDVREHLIQARDEAIAIKGMGLKDLEKKRKESTDPETDPSVSPQWQREKTSKGPQKRKGPGDTDIYVAEAWVNRGRYEQKPDFRARGQVYMMRPPHTGISVVLKEEKTKTRIRQEKEAKEIKKRLGKNMWMQMPDRKVTNQSQYVLW